MRRQAVPGYPVTYEQSIGCLTRAEKRLKILPILFEEENYGDVIAETVDIVRVSLDGLLNYAGVEPPGDDAESRSDLLRDSLPNLPRLIAEHIEQICELASKVARLRDTRARTLTGSGERVSREDAERAIAWGRFMVDLAQHVIKDIDD